MRRLLLAGVLALAVTTARADVMVQNMLSGTGDNVTFQSFAGNLAIGSFNGMHTGVVNFTDLSNNPLFTGSANGNDIKIANTNDLQVIVYSNVTDTQILTTSTQVFSLKGTGDVKAIVQATDGTFTFDLGTINPNAQSGFTLTATNGEVMNQLTLLDIGGEVTDYEHYRIDVAGPLAPVPGPVVGAGIPGALSSLGLLGLAALRRRRGR